MIYLHLTTIENAVKILHEQHEKGFLNFYRTPFFIEFGEGNTIEQRNAFALCVAQTLQLGRYFAVLRIEGVDSDGLSEDGCYSMLNNIYPSCRCVYQIRQRQLSANLLGVYELKSKGLKYHFLFSLSLWLAKLYYHLLHKSARKGYSMNKITDIATLKQLENFYKKTKRSLFGFV